MEATSPVVDAANKRRERPLAATDPIDTMAQNREAQWQRARSGTP
jgi:hypothetical protein